MSTYDIPGASVYGQAVELAKKRYQTRLADINKQRSSTLRQAGFLADIDPETGLTSNMRTDPYNAYGGYQLLNRSQAQRHDEMLGQNVSRGIGSRGGLGAQALTDLRFSFGKEDSDFGSNLTESLGALTRQQQDEKYAFDQALYEAQLAAAQSAIESGDYGDYGGGYDYPEYSEPTPTTSIRPGIRPAARPKPQPKPRVVRRPKPVQSGPRRGRPGSGTARPKKRK